MKLPAGFTLIELLIVIAIIGILSAISIPSFSSFNTNQRLSQAAKQVKQDLRSAQNRAINGVKDSNGYGVWGVRFATSNAHTYDAFACENFEILTCVCTEVSSVSKSLADDFVFDIAASGNDKFIFDEISGEVCDSSGQIFAGGSGSIEVDLGASSRTITVSAGGKIEEE